MTARPDPATPVLVPLVLPELADVELASLDPTVAHEGLRVAGGDPGSPAGVRLRSSRWLDVHWAGGTFDDVDLAGARLVRMRFTDVSAASLRAAESTWRDVEVLGSRVGAMELDLADLQSVRLEGCRISYLNLRGATVRDFLVAGCRIEELDLVGGSAERVRLTDCRVGQLSLHGATMSAVDLRGADLCGVTGVDGLTGAIITDVQLAELAGTLAEHLGIRVGADLPPTAAGGTGSRRGAQTPTGARSPSRSTPSRRPPPR